MAAAAAAAEPAVVVAVAELGVRRVGAVLREARRELPRFNGRNAISRGGRARVAGGNDPNHKPVAAVIVGNG